MNDSRRSNDEKLQSLLNASLLLNSTLSMKDILHTLSLHATQHTGGDRCTLYLVEAKHLVSEVALGDGMQELRMPLGEGIAGHVAASGQRLLIDDAYRDERFNPASDKSTGYKTRNMLVVPIKDRTGSVIGVLQVLNKEGGEGFSEEDARYLEIMAGHAAVAIQNARVYENLAHERNDLQKENSRLRRSGSKKVEPIGSNPRFRDAVEMAEGVAQSTANVLLRGESGSGKGIFARYIHQQSKRANGPLVQINCSAIPEDLIEAELFGIEKGVATGVDARKGRLEMANRGSCFLDEIGDMSNSAQTKVLKVIEDRELERVGGRQVFPIDVRIVAATHRDLEQAIKTKEFRADLYYRLNVVSIWIPPLRARGQDVLELAQFFVGRFSKSNGRGRMRISNEVLAMLQSYAWPGNVRELENVIERAVILSRDTTIEPSVLPQEMRNERAALSAELMTIPVPAMSGGPPVEAPMPNDAGLRESLEDFERVLIRNALRNERGVQTEAARRLGISESNLRYKIKKLGIDGVV